MYDGVLFWVLAVILLLGSFDSNGKLTLGTLLFLFFCAYAPILLVNVCIPHYEGEEIGREIRKCRQPEAFEQIVFVTEDQHELPGGIFCPYIRPFTFSKNNVSLAYNIDVESAKFEYSQFYKQDRKDEYVWLGQKVNRKENSALPITLVSDVRNGSRVDVLFTAKWSRLSIFEIRKAVILNSEIHVVPHPVGQTYEQWKSVCLRSVASVTKNKRIAVTYVCDDMIDYAFVGNRNGLSLEPEELSSREACEMPKKRRPVDLRQDIYRQWDNLALNVTDVQPTALVGGGMTVKILFEPISDTLCTNMIYQYYANDSFWSTTPIVLDYKNVIVLPNQTCVDIYVAEAYDQFSLIWLSDSVPGSLPARMDDDTYVDQLQMRALDIDHRSGFWERMFYDKYNVFKRWTVFLWFFALCLVAGGAYWGIDTLIERKRQ